MAASPEDRVRVRFSNCSRRGSKDRRPGNSVRSFGEFGRSRILPFFGAQCRRSGDPHVAPNRAVQYTHTRQEVLTHSFRVIILTPPRENQPMGVLDQRFEKNFMISSVDYVFNWARKSAIWPLTFGLACCAIEMIASTTSRFDMARFGAEVFRPSPRQADLMIVAGTVTLKMAPVLKRVWEQMPDPKWCISMGACSSVGGPFNAYSVLQGVDKIVPVDVYVVGCPPRPEGLFYALLKLQDKIDEMTLAKRPTEVRLRPEMVEDFKRGVMVAQTPQPR
jgi:NADH-quinone oxidoreductase subunit B